MIMSFNPPPPTVILKEPTGHFASHKQCVHCVWGWNFLFRLPPDLELVRLFNGSPEVVFLNLVSTFKEKDNFI